ncbi:hypothetical protein JCM8547_002997 [Rhodosporidiobolus lusitaniae]
MLGDGVHDVRFDPAFIQLAKQRAPAGGGGSTSRETSSGASTEGLYAFKYSSKPASLDPSASGTIWRVPPSSFSTSSASKGAAGKSDVEGAIWASFPSTKVGVGKSKGKVAEQRFNVTEQPASKGKEVDVVLLWDDETQTWSLSPLVSTLTLKPDRSSKPPPTPAVPTGSQLQAASSDFFSSGALNPFAGILSSAPPYTAAPPAPAQIAKPAPVPAPAPVTAPGASPRLPSAPLSSPARPPSRPSGLASLLNPATSPASAPPGASTSAAPSDAEEDDDEDDFEEVPLAIVPDYLRSGAGSAASKVEVEDFGSIELSPAMGSSATMAAKPPLAVPPAALLAQPSPRLVTLALPTARQPSPLPALPAAGPAQPAAAPAPPPRPRPPPQQAAVPPSPSIPAGPLPRLPPPRSPALPSALPPSPTLIPAPRSPAVPPVALPIPRSPAQPQPQPQPRPSFSSKIPASSSHPPSTAPSDQPHQQPHRTYGSKLPASYHSGPPPGSRVANSDSSDSNSSSGEDEEESEDEEMEEVAPAGSQPARQAPPVPAPVPAGVPLRPPSGGGGKIHSSRPALVGTGGKGGGGKGGGGGGGVGGGGKGGFKRAVPDVDLSSSGEENGSGSGEDDSEDEFDALEKQVKGNMAGAGKGGGKGGAGSRGAQVAVAQREEWEKMQRAQAASKRPVASSHHQQQPHPMVGRKGLPQQARQAQPYDPNRPDDDVPDSSEEDSD